MIQTASSVSKSTAPFSVFTAASPLHDAAALGRLIESYLVPLRRLGGEDWQPETGVSPEVVFVVTGGTEGQILSTVRADQGEPVVLLAHPGHNSLPAALETLARMHQLGARARIHYLRGIDDQDGWSGLAGAIHAGAVKRALMKSRIGLFGNPSDWLVASSPSPETVRFSWGPLVVPLSLESLLAEPKESAVAGDALAREFAAGASALVNVSPPDLAAASGVYEGLHRAVEAERLDAVAVRCFDLLTQRHTTGCLALAHLNDNGIIAGCEGDMVSTVTMLWLYRMFGNLPWMANPSRMDLEHGVLTLAHCTVPRTGSCEYRLRSHFESGIGVGIQGTLPAGPVTLVRIGGSDMKQLRALNGNLLRNTDHADLCRTQVEIETGRQALEDILANPLGNHMVMVPGHHAAVLKRWHETMIA